MTQAILDGSTVPIMYESRMARVGLNQKILDQIDDYYKQIEESGEADDYAINNIIVLYLFLVICFLLFVSC